MTGTETPLSLIAMIAPYGTALRKQEKSREKSEDQLARLAARSERERIAAKRRLADLSPGEIVRQPLIDPAEDDVSRLLLETFEEETFQPIKSMTVRELREYILDDATGGAKLKRLQSAT